MSSKTKIPWTERTWSPVVGCSKCSPGCLNCYAERMAKRQVAMGCARGGDNTATWIAYSDAINPDTGKWSGDVALRYDQLDKPLHWPKPCRIFVCSMSDLFHPKVPFEFLTKVMVTIEKCPQHTFQILTKRPEIMKRCYEDFTPLKNLWLGVTVCTQKEADEKIPILLQIPAAVRFLSIEPCLGNIIFDKSWLTGYNSAHESKKQRENSLPKGRQRQEQQNRKSGISDNEGTSDTLNHISRACIPKRQSGKVLWCIVGCESGPKRRPCKIEWVQSIVEQCKATGVKLFIKQINIDGKIVKMPKAYPQELPERP